MEKIVLYPTDKILPLENVKEPGAIKIMCVVSKGCLDGIFSGIYVLIIAHALLCRIRQIFKID